MRTDNVVRVEAMEALLATLGAVDAERFIKLIKRDCFDYTEWQRGLWEGQSIEEIHVAATARENQMKQPRYNAETEAAMREAKAIVAETVKTKTYSSATSFFEEMDDE